MTRSQPDTDQLLEQASMGNDRAVDLLLQRHRRRLRQMVALRIDARLSARVDASDVVQDAVTLASQRLPEYLRDRPVPFYPWLRQIAWQRLIDLHRRHITAARRSVTRQQPLEMKLSDRSAIQLADRLVGSATSPSQTLVRKEQRERVRGALAKSRPGDREILVLLYLEQLSIRETSAVLGITERAVTMRHLRALQRIRPLLVDE